METRIAPRQTKLLRRYSCPAVSLSAANRIAISEESTGNVPVKRARLRVDRVTLLPVESLKYPMPQLAQRLSHLTENKTFEETQRPTSSPSLSMRNRNSSKKLPVDAESETTDAFNLQQSCAPYREDLNEAEIIDRHFYYGQRHSSLPNVLGGERLSLGVSGSGNALGGHGNGQGQMQRRNSLVESVERDLRSLQRNTIEDRRLVYVVSELDRQSFAGVIQHRHKKNEIDKEHRKLCSKSPTADEWLRLRKSRTSTLQEREREDISRRYSRRARHFRAPLELQEMVAKVRSLAMVEAGFQEQAGKLNRSSDNSSDQTKNQMMPKSSLHMSRRHSISGDVINGLPARAVNSIQSPTSTSRRIQRRMTLADIRSFQEILEVKADHMSKVCADGCLEEQKIQYLSDVCKESPEEIASNSEHPNDSHLKSELDQTFNELENKEGKEVSEKRVDLDLDLGSNQTEWEKLLKETSSNGRMGAPEKQEVVKEKEEEEAICLYHEREFDGRNSSVEVGRTAAAV